MLEAKEGGERGKSSPQRPDPLADTSSQRQGGSSAQRLVQQGGKRPGKVNVSDTKQRSVSQKEEKEGMVPMAAVAAKCPLDWPSAVTSNGGKIGVT